MTSPRPPLLNLDPHRILITVDPHFDDALNMTGRLALAPEALARAAVIPRLATLDGFAQSLGIHVRDHQNIARMPIGGDAGDKPIGIEFRRECAAFLDLFGRAARREMRELLGHSRIISPEPAQRTESAIGSTHHGKEANLLILILTERTRELGRDRL